MELINDLNALNAPNRQEHYFTLKMLQMCDLQTYMSGTHKGIDKQNEDGSVYQIKIKSTHVYCNQSGRSVNIFVTLK